MFKQYKNTLYDIYDDGRCFSHRTNKFLTPKMSETYPSYHLVIDGKKKQVKVHRMVAETFLAPIDGKNIVNHIDGDTHNFNLKNLEWVTSSENSQHAYNSGLRKDNNIKINKFLGNLPDEEWMEIKDYPLYVISSCGRIMNIRTKRILKTYQDNSGGYECANLWKNGVGKTVRVHTLVYMNFSKDYDLTGMVINHIDGNKLNNNFNNLEKVTYQENNIHAVYTIKTNNCCKSVVQYDLEGNRIDEFPSIAAATRETGIQNISRSIKRNGQAGGYIWKFK